ncbi:DUF4175 family protein [Polaribacter sp. IC073]|uniref:DUF4175 family protein n=1 Tax=Polaribacter sp. IC073 TaxID=2508540 RepID=UPI0011BE37BC|nr:DUF4175 family protein [Polaribacter sp. IC073]TXD49980.1 hypothetical protein ES045_02025 [Polaribacter sp. IC073]
MSGFKTIEDKLHQFTRKYYVNELIKGIILFFSLGLLYLLFTLFLEYFLWLKPTARTILFWLFILVEVFLIIRFIAMPIFKLIGLRKGISLEDSSKIIGNHFPEVKDKLLNVLQLKENSNQSDLLLASINQKAAELQPIPFVKAVDFSKNTKYLKYTMVPVLIWLITSISGNNAIFTKSLDRVVNYRTAYLPPAPFAFSLNNKSLQVVQGKSILIAIETIGEVLPSEAKIVYDHQQYYLQNNQNGSFSYTFSDVQKPINFHVAANGVQSKEFQIKVINVPTINNISLALKYPSYIGKKNEVIPNSGNLLVPEGTHIIWNVAASQTDEVVFINNDKRNVFKKVSKDNFEFSKRIRNPLMYQISSSNKNLQDYEKLQFSVNVIKDEVPEISVQTNIDSISRGVAQFAGQVSDDYGLNKLQLVYYDENNPQNTKWYILPISKANVQTFFYQFPEGLDLQKGTNYELFFEVYDNDAVNGNKKAKSKVFNYRQKTNDEVEEELLQEQRNTIHSLENSIQKQQKQQEVLDKIQEELQNKKKVSWNDKKKVESFIKRQEQYKKMMQRQTDKLQENLDEKKEENQSLQDKKEELKKRIEELKKTDRQQKLLDEIAKLAEKLNKEELVKKAKELAQQNKQQERSLERTLELVKRFYVEQKTMQIANKLEELAKKQEGLEKKENSTLAAQKIINEEFKELKKQLDELAKDNEKLKEPMELPDVEDEKEAIDEALKKSEENLEKKDNKSVKKSQKKSADKMKEMSAKMRKAMLEMEGESIEENMEDLRKILENLVTFSFKQEGLMNKFDVISTSHPDFGKDLKEQNDIRTYFEHIDDSLYVLSMRLPKISAKIQDDLSTAHYNLEQSLENFSENRFDNGISNQRYVMTSTNNLADYLSDMLNSMKNASMKMGKGKGKGKGFSLPDIIKKQGELSEKMNEGMKKGEKPGDKEGKGKDGKKPGDKGKEEKNGKSGDKGKDGKGGKSGENGKNGQGNATGENEDLDGELYEIYKQQSQLRQQLQDAIKESENGNSNGNGDAKKVLKTMEQLENEILEKGFNGVTIQKMQRLNYELLKLDKAALEQGKDNKRMSSANLKEYQRNQIKALEFKKQFYNQIEILNRQSLPLQQNYKLKVREYFSEPKKIK